MDEKQTKVFKRRIPMCTKCRKWLPIDKVERRLWTKMRADRERVLGVSK